MCWRIGIVGTDVECNLRLDIGNRSRIRNHDSQVTTSFVVKTKVFGETLGAKKLKVSLICKVSDAPGVFVQITGSKPLVGTVKKGEEFLVSHQISNLTPLFLSGIHAGRIVSARMQNNDSAFWSVTQILHHAIKVQAPSILVPIAIFSHFLKSSIFENHVVVAPSRIRNVADFLA